MFSTPNKTTQDVKDEQTHFKRLICHRAFDDDLLLSRNALFASELIGQIISRDHDATHPRRRTRLARLTQSPPTALCAPTYRLHLSSSLCCFQGVAGDPVSGRSSSILNRNQAVLFHSHQEIQMKQFNKYLSAALLAVTLVSVVGCASTSQKEGTGEYVDDAVITTKVKAAIFNESTLKSAEINVETFKGVVQMSGFVNSQADINTAVQLARGVKGVVSVKNDMRVK